MNNLKLILLAFLISSCGAPRETYNLKMTLTNGKVVERQYRLPDSLKLYINDKSCLVYTKADSSCYSIRRNVINFKIEKQ